MCYEGVLISLGVQFIDMMKISAICSHIKTDASSI